MDTGAKPALPKAPDDDATADRRFRQDREASPPKNLRTRSDNCSVWLIDLLSTGNRHAFTYRSARLSCRPALYDCDLLDPEPRGSRALLPVAGQAQDRLRPDQPRQGLDQGKWRVCEVGLFDLSIRSRGSASASTPLPWTGFSSWPDTRSAPGSIPPTRLAGQRSRPPASD